MHAMPAIRTAALPLHTGAAPAWLFQRMVQLAQAMATIIVADQGPQELLRRLSDPFWFQAFGCVLGFDWHSSGVTTTVCGALKEAAKRSGNDFGLVVCGGKGGTSRKTPQEITAACEKTGLDPEPLIYASKIAAKVDNTAVQDGYQLYHHVFFLAPKEHAWCVVQQGMNTVNRYARRYHWLSEKTESFIAEPHAAVACDERQEALNLVAGESEAHRRALAEVAREHPERILREMRPLLEGAPLPLFADKQTEEDLQLPDRHTITTADIHPGALKKVLITTYERQAGDFEALLGTPGIGPQAMRSLSLIAEVLFNAPASRRDPAAYSFAHGGKDGHPYRVNRPLYDANIERLKEVIAASKLGSFDKMKAFKALAEFTARLD